MGSTSYAITQVNTGTAANSLEDFWANDVQGGMLHLANPEAAVYLHCWLDNHRRILVVTDANQSYVRVCIEAAYELFEGDTHYYVKRIGTVEREDVATSLQPLLQTAHDELIAWTPTHENIWDNVY